MTETWTSRALPRGPAEGDVETGLGSQCPQVEVRGHCSASEPAGAWPGHVQDAPGISCANRKVGTVPLHE